MIFGLRMFSVRCLAVAEAYLVRESSSVGMYIIALGDFRKLDLVFLYL
ncbi:hypothetical protein KC19_2G270800 [Ceratodon purpureus]|uniref:Uncharacterized protein n=1 Tax=Ceratodon purpureus TaxID=3225 RepID=A0A8T0IYK8_CERPU|nr:hypothetical protein KC19_2G270800 [Ceratodon purpureus]